MILIISDINDPSTNEVIDWLNFFNQKFIRINAHDIFDLDYLQIEQNKINWKITSNKIEVEFHQIKITWFRKGKITLNKLSINLLSNPELKEFLDNEVLILEDFLMTSLKTKHYYGDIIGTINKINVLHFAAKVGLKIPDTFVFTRSSQIKNLDYKKEQLITKPIFEVNRYLIGDKLMSSYTTKLNSIRLTNDKCFYTLIQNEIYKEFEVRSFIFDNEIYSVAILSQKNNNTKIDFRNYDKENPNRVIKFILPIIIQEKIFKLMNYLGLNSGSVDLIYSYGNYIFLEINPVGQFSVLSFKGNFNIEKIIALKLYNNA